MDQYQKDLINKFSKWRPSPKYPTYPPYHEGLYLEDYFFDKFIKENKTHDRYYIPVFWTTIYVDNCHYGIQNDLDSLDQTKKYFTVAQHDDAIRERLPKDTICFNAGGNGGGIPIPLICSPLSDEIKPNLERDIFCSFVGSITHPIRANLYSTLNHNKKYHFSVRHWSSSVPKDEFDNFINITSRSIFCLAPRGYGRSSFRLYEAMQLGAIPVFIYDDKWCPWDDEIDWSEFCVLIHESKINDIDFILNSYITAGAIEQMQTNLKKYWQANFTMDSIYKKVLERI